MHATRRTAHEGLSTPAVVLGLAATLALSACAGNVGRPVTEDAKDTEGRYDGIWIAKVDVPDGKQEIDRWVMRCPAVKFEWEFEVDDGIARIVMREDEDTTTHEGFVEGSGRFRVEMPLERTAKAGPGSDSQISNGSMKVIFEGDLGIDEPRGFYVVGVQEFLYRGCRHRVHYEKKPA